MIIGVGTDICDIRRIEDSLSKFGEKFTARIFTKNEQDYANSTANPSHAYAKRFAAKEALAKALSYENSGHLSWTDVEVTRAPSGKPGIELSGAALVRAAKMTPNGHQLMFHLSLSDEPPYAQAFVVIDAVPLHDKV